MDLLHIFATAFNAIIPIVLVIGFGYFLRLKGLLPKAFVQAGNKLGFQVLMPIMLFMNVYTIESFSAIRWDVVIFCIGMEFVLFFLGYLTVGWTTRVYNRRGVLLQNVFRSNVAIIGMSLTAALGDAQAMAITSVVLAFIQPVLNSLAVVSLSVFSEGGEKLRFRDVWNKIVSNPMIHGIAVGIVFLILRSAQNRLFGRVVFSLREDLKFLYTALNNLKTVASPFMLLILGGQFDFSASQGMFREIVSGTLWRVVIAPVLVFAAAAGLTGAGVVAFGPEVYPALIALFASPTAVSSAIMAGQMGHDQQLATQLVVWTSIISIVTIFASVCVLMVTGLLVV